MYRTDYEAKQKNRFKWTPAITVDDHGDPKNSTASVLYVIHNTTPVTWEKLYIQNFDGGKVYSQDGDEQALIRSITLWQGSKSIVLTSSEAGDAYYLFEMNNVNGLLGSWEASDEAKMRALNESTKVVTLKHPVYFLDNETPLPQPDDKQINGYAWTWKYTYGNTDMSQLYFYYSASKDTADNESSVNNQEYLNQWVPVFFSGTPPQRSDSTPAYWYNWGDLTGWARST